MLINSFMQFKKEFYNLLEDKYYFNVKIEFYTKSEYIEDKDKKISITKTDLEDIMNWNKSIKPTTYALINVIWLQFRQITSYKITNIDVLRDILQYFKDNKVSFFI